MSDTAHPGPPRDRRARRARSTTPVFDRLPPPAYEPVGPALSRLEGRPRVAGRCFAVGDHTMELRGVTYGTFRRHPDGHDYPDVEVVRRDFAKMARWGFNAVRTYTAPPRWLLDIAWQTGLRVMVGLSWTQHVTFLDDRKVTRDIRRRVSEAAENVAGHDALLAFAVGNEIPSPIVRWHGPAKVERFVRELYDIVKCIDCEALVTYVNYPTTEYLDLRFLDFQAFNVYLEERETLGAYLARLHNLADERPLVMAEIGLDSRRKGELAQAESLRWQVQTSLQSGCAGAFVFKWTDEWHRGGFDVEDWDFGLVTRDRNPKPALFSVSEAFRRGAFQPAKHWPRISVVVCTYNGCSTIRRTLETLSSLDYPDYEVIVVNDGSTDDTESIVREFDVRLISTENRGLSSARNTGAEAATGEIVAYLDDDAYPAPQWLHFLASTYEDGDFVAVGGPNILPPESSLVAECVSYSPGGPTHVLLSDTEAEHLPGCNLSIRRDALLAIGGFDTAFRTAGDDVDVCWRLQEAGGTLGFHPGAMVWHHSRDSVGRYWRQQKGYGRAEGMLERKWPEKYNAAGHLSWAGRLYGPGFWQNFGWARCRVYYGLWGSEPFQTAYHPHRGLLSVAMMPEWHVLVVQLVILSLLGLMWWPLLLMVPVTLVVLGVPLVQALRLAARAARERPWTNAVDRVPFFLLTTALHLGQPLARLWGRFGEGLTPWRKLGLSGWAPPVTHEVKLWREQWRPLTDWISRLRSEIKSAEVRITDGGPHDRWDIEVRAGLLGGARVLSTVEDHGGGRQYLRFRIWPVVRFELLMYGLVAYGGLGGLALAAGEIAVGATLWTFAGIGAAMVAYRCGAALATVRRAINGLGEDTVADAGSGGDRE